MSDIEEQFKQLYRTNVTNTIHRGPYPAILPSRPELSQAGRVVLITGGGTSIGHSIARSFVRASANTVIIIGRRSDVLEAAGSRLVQEAETSGTNTKIITRTCDIVDLAQVNAFWEDLTSRGITVDVFVSNAAKFTQPKSILELGADEVWSQVEVNAKAPLYFTEKFYSQPGEKQKVRGSGVLLFHTLRIGRYGPTDMSNNFNTQFIVNVSTQSSHGTSHPGIAVRPAYTLSKMAGTLLFQLIAQNTPPEKMQIISFHPGLIYNDTWKGMGLPPDDFDDGKIFMTLIF